MAVIVTIVIILYLVVMFLSRNVEVSAQGSCFNRILLRMAKWIYQAVPFVTRYSGTVKENLNMLHPAKNDSQLIEEYYVEKIRLLLLVVFAGNAMVVILVIRAHLDAQIQVSEGSYILRGETGEGEKEVEATAYFTMEESPEHVPVTITVSEKHYSREETELFFEELSNNLATDILGENSSADEITDRLKLQDIYGDNPVTVSWTSSDYGLVDEDGSVYNEELSEPVSVVLSAELSYEEQKREIEIPLTVVPEKLSTKQQFIKDLKQQLIMADEAGKEADRINLPDVVDGRRVHYVEKNTQSVRILWMLFVIAAILLYKQRDQHLEELVKKRQNMLIAGYPEFVSKLTLLVNAGLTVRGAIKRIVEQQESRMGRERSGVCYEEWRIALSEMDNGVYEEKAYENLGKRIRLPAYTKLSGLLAQNVKKGSKDMLRILEKESLLALEEQKRETRRLGEEAGTKLLIPMMLMLVIVMILIMLPAFLSYQI